MVHQKIQYKIVITCLAVYLLSWLTLLVAVFYMVYDINVDYKLT